MSDHDIQKDNKPKSGLSKFWKNTSELAKKATESVQEGFKNLSELTKKNIKEAKIKKFNPLFAEDFQRESFKIPNVIEIVDDAVRRSIDVCEGAIGWMDKVNEVEVLHLYDEWIQASAVQFIPVPKCDEIYCVDPFNRKRFINCNNIFEIATEEKLAELDYIAYCLGAKSCAIEIVESNANVFSLGTQGKYGKSEVEAQQLVENSNNRSGKIVSSFKGSNKPQTPALKWFAHDDNIKGLIEMRCAKGNLIKSKTLELKGSSSATMSQKVAGAIDKILGKKASFSIENKVIKEYNSKLIFEIDFNE